MCYMFYILANRELPTIHQHERYPDLTISHARWNVMWAIRRRIPTRHVYYAASWQSCGCGFSYEERTELERVLADIPDAATCAIAREQWQAGYRSVTSLGCYLADHIKMEPLLLYIAWAGGEGKPIKVKAAVDPTYFGGVLFEPPDEHTVLTIIPIPTASTE